jgi:hypothetical protein
MQNAATSNDKGFSIFKMSMESPCDSVIPPCNSAEQKLLQQSQIRLRVFVDLKVERRLGLIHAIDF